MWILNANGSLESAKTPRNAIAIDPEAINLDVIKIEPGSIIVVHFKSFADGRGFSLARQLRRAQGDDITLLADGHVLPDQARHAFQSGFDGVLISNNALQRYGKASWEQALQSAVGTLYSGERAGGGIWARRHSAHATDNQTGAA